MATHKLDELARGNGVPQPIQGDDGASILRPRAAAAATLFVFASLLLALGLASGSRTERATAASSAGCEGGGFSLVLPGTTIRGARRGTVPAAGLGTSFLVKGKYVEFRVVSATFAVRSYTFTGAPNPLDMTGGRRTVVFASKTPNHRGLTLTSALDIRLKDTDLVIQRAGRGPSMKIQAKDCANGGLFQMEPTRGDRTRTRITHTLAAGVFYFDNPTFRAREGDASRPRARPRR